MRSTRVTGATCGDYESGANSHTEVVTLSDHSDMNELLSAVSFRNLALGLCCGAGVLGALCTLLI